MTAYRSRMRQALARQQAEQEIIADERARLGQRLRHAIRAEHDRYRLLSARDGGNPVLFRTGPEIIAGALWQFGVHNELLSERDRPAWVRGMESEDEPLSGSLEEREMEGETS